MQVGHSSDNGNEEKMINFTGDNRNDCRPFFMLIEQFLNQKGRAVALPFLLRFAFYLIALLFCIPFLAVGVDIIS